MRSTIRRVRNGAVARARRGGRTAVVAVLVSATGLGLTGCGAITKAIVNRATHGALYGNSVLNSFTSKVKNGDAVAYDVTYETTGSSPSTIEYAEQPPNEFSYMGSGSGGSGQAKIIENSTGEYYCDQGSSGSGSGSAWTCLKLAATDSTTYQDLFQFYTGSYWLTILEAYSTVAGLTGVKIRSTSMTVNGFKMSCIVVSGGQGNTGTSTYCVTAQGILGYVSSSGDTSNFEIKSYSATPAASLFQLPAGATITTLPVGTSVPVGTT